MFDRISQIMAYTRPTKKRYAKDVKLNIERLTIILAFWQLELYTKNYYIKEPVLQEINDFLISQSSYGSFRGKGHVTMKDIQRAEGNILKDLFSLENNQTPQFYFNKLPEGTLTHYRQMIHNLDELIPEDYGLIKKLQHRNIEIKYNGHIFTWVVRKEIMRKLIYNIAYQYKYIMTDAMEKKVQYIIERLFLQREILALGDLPSLCIVLLDYITPTKLELQENMPKRFYTRINAYRGRIIPLLEKLAEVSSDTDVTVRATVEETVLLTDRKTKEHDSNGHVDRAHQVHAKNDSDVLERTLQYYNKYDLKEENRTKGSSSNTKRYSRYVKYKSWQ